MNGFIEVHDPQFDRIVVVNPDCIAEYADHYILVDRAHSIETKETREEIAALIAAEYTTVTCNCDVPKHATADPKEIGVDVERVWERLVDRHGGGSVCKSITINDLAKALGAKENK